MTGSTVWHDMTDKEGGKNDTRTAGKMVRESHAIQLSLERSTE
jgi:hypothetical protein